ncbi:hypothetical protein ACU1JV_00745 [Paenibacillus sp. T2-29]|uniref:hypothetical protein n=1 Tax=Paenibacillus TaxID=44249 RepID=UPI0039BD4991
MKKDRTEAEEILIEKIKKIKSKAKIVNQIVENITNKGMPFGVFNEVSRGSLSLDTVDIPFLAVLMNAIYETTGDKEIDPDIFFSRKEIEESEYIIKDVFKRESLNLPIVLNDVIQLDEQTYVTKIESTLLVRMYHSNIIEYNFETQRSAKYKEGRDGVVPVPDVNKKSVADIAKHVLNQSYLPDMMTLNVYSFETNPVYFDSSNRNLTISEGAIVSILDGFHRLQGFVKAHLINPNLKFTMILSVRVYDTDTAKRYFGQINTVNIVKKERIEELKAEKYSDQVVKDLQTNPKSELKGNKIASAPRISQIADQLTTFSILSYAIEHTFSPANFKEYKETAKYLIEFFGYLLSYYYDEFLGDPQKYRDQYKNHPLMFLGYTVIAKKFFDSKRDISEINEVIDEIDFSDNALISLLNDKKAYYASKRAKNNIIEYFNKKYNEVI